MSQELTVTVSQSLQPIIDLVINGLDSEHSKRAYSRALNDFLAWHTETSQQGLSKSVVMAHRQALIDRGLSASTVNQHMSAIRKLAQEASDNGLLDGALAAGIARAKGVKKQGVRTGNWLTRAQAQKLINTPDTSTLKGLRDRAILAVLIGAGLRRSEVVALTLGHIQQREGRWAIIDLVGKGNRIRTVAIAAWVKTCIDAWTDKANISDGLIFRGMNRHGQIIGESMSDQAVGDLVTDYGHVLGLEIDAHDLRRTFAKLARKAGSELEQIQLSLGHASISTTQLYLGSDLNLEDAPSDRIKIRIGDSDD